MREQENLNLKFMIQVDTMCHRLPHFIEKAGRAGVRRVFIGLESINPVAKNYNDVALTPDEDTDTAELEVMLTQIIVAR